MVEAGNSAVDEHGALIGSDLHIKTRNWNREKSQIKQLELS